MDRSSLHVQNCTFLRNKAEDEGGALYTLRIKSVTISSCRFEENESEENDGGGAYVQRPQEDDDDNLAVASRLDVRDTIFRENEAKESGGGLYAAGVKRRHQQLRVQGEQGRTRRVVAFTCCPTISTLSATCASAIRWYEATRRRRTAAARSWAPRRRPRFTDVVVEENAVDGGPRGRCLRDTFPERRRLPAGRAGLHVPREHEHEHGRRLATRTAAASTCKGRFQRLTRRL